MKVEYQVIPVTRFMITRWHSDGTRGGCEQRGEYDNPNVAWEVAYALCKAEHDKSGEPLGSENFQYPPREQWMGDA